MKSVLVLLVLMAGVSANAKSVVFKIIEGNGDPREVKFKIPAKNQTVFERVGWTCKVISVSPDWGMFTCTDESGAIVSDRYKCKKQTNADEGQSFNLQKGTAYNITFSHWCE